MTLIPGRLAHPQQVKDKNHRKYIVIFTVCLVGLSVHLGFIALFHYFDEYLLSYFNILSVFLWAWALIENYYGRHARAIFIGCIEIAAHATLAATQLGLGFGFELYLWPLACLLAINPSMGKSAALMLSMLCISGYVLIHLMLGDVVIQSSLLEYQNIVFALNSFSAAFPLVLSVAGISFVNEQQQKELTDMATKDDLTGLFNRRYLHSVLKHYYEKAKRSKEPFCVVMADIDFFKKVNDRFGHDVGDEVLVSVASELNANIRASDILCRWGGEEFLIIFTGSELEQTYGAVEKIRLAIESKVKVGTDSDYHLTMSFGLTQYCNKESIEGLIKRADQLLYQAKDQGRNRIETELIGAQA